MKIVKANQYHLLANYDITHENRESKPISSLSRTMTRRHENSQSKPISSLSKS